MRSAGDLAALDGHLFRAAETPGGGTEHFRFAQHDAAAPVAPGDETRPPKTAGASDPTRELQFDLRIGHGRAQRLGMLGRHGAGSNRFVETSQLHLRPIFAALGRRQVHRFAQPIVLLFEDRRLRLRDALAVATQNARANFLFRWLGALARQNGAQPQANQIQRIGHGRRFIEVVDAPSHAAVGIAPQTKILQMNVTDRENGRTGGGLGRILQNGFSEAPISSTQEREGVFADFLVIPLHVGCDKSLARLLAQPAVIGLGRLLECRNFNGLRALVSHTRSPSQPG